MSSRKKEPMTVQMAVEQQAEGGGQVLRDQMIEFALREGRTVSEIAEVLGLSQQAIYNVRERLRDEPQTVQGGSTDERAVARALEDFTDPSGFETLVFPLLQEIDATAIPHAGSGDRGRDAAAPDSSSIYTISLSRQWQRKVRSDLAKIAAEGFKPDRVFAITNRRTSPKAKDKLIDEAAEQGIKLTVLDQTWLEAKLSEPRHLHLRSGRLNLAPPRSKAFLKSSEYQEVLDGRTHLAGLDVAFQGRREERKHAVALLEESGVVLVVGAGGLGKTRLALEMALEQGGEWCFIDADMQFTVESINELPVSKHLTVVIDNAHRRLDDLGALLSALERLPFHPKVVLIARPGYRDEVSGVTAGVWLGPISKELTIELGPLGWKPMSEMLKAPPLEIESGPQRGAIVQLAEGNPQIAVIAARVAKERRSVLGLSGDELLQRYIAYLIPTTLAGDSDSRRQRQLLALLAALGGIDVGEDEVLREIAGMLRSTPEQVADRLEQLAESGLVVGDRARYRIKPDLLAEHILFALALTEKWDLALDYQLIVERFGKKHTHRLVKALGALPSYLFKGKPAERVRTLEDEVCTAIKDVEPTHAAVLIRDLSRARPKSAFEMADLLLRRMREGGDAIPEPAIEALREGAMRISDFRTSWRILLRLGAESKEGSPAAKKIAETMAETYERVPEDDRASGMILAEVQEALAEETQKFWNSRSPGAAAAVAHAVKPMLMLQFRTSRLSPDNPMSVEIGGRILPVSEYTKRVVRTGAQIAAEIFTELSPAGQLQLLETLGWAAHTSAGFSMGLGQHAPIEGRVLLDAALSEVDREIAGILEKLEMPVQANAEGYLRKRSKYRRKLAQEIEQDSEDIDPGRTMHPVVVPSASPELAEYLTLINNKDLGPPDFERAPLRAQHARKLALARETAESLLSDSTWRDRVDRWSRWWEQRRNLEKQPWLGPVIGMTLEATALIDPIDGTEVINHLITTQSDLRGAAGAAMAAVINTQGEEAWRRWIDFDPQTRATLAGALGRLDGSAGAEPLRRLAFDEDEIVRRAATSALAFGPSFERWRVDLSLEAVAGHPDLEGLETLLHMIEHRAEEEGKEKQLFDADQLELLESAVLATANCNRLVDYEIADLLRRAESEQPGIAMRWVWARLERLNQIRTNGDDLWDLDFLPDTLAPVVMGAADSADLEHAIRYFQALDSRSPALPDAGQVIGWLDQGSEQVTQLIIDLLGDPDRAWLARQYLLGFAIQDKELERRAVALAETTDDPIMVVHSLIAGTLPNSWSGSYVPHLEGAQALAERWARSKSGALRQAARTAVESYQRQITKETATDIAEERELEYR
jgi:DNA-binding Lrp family transcriptional regulator